MCVCACGWVCGCPASGLNNSQNAPESFGQNATGQNTHPPAPPRHPCALTGLPPLPDLPPLRKITLQMHTPARTSQGWCWQTPAWTRSANLEAPPTPGVVKQDKSSGGSVDTTKTRSGPQRVRMCGGERPIGAAKGKQSDAEAVCQPPPPSPHRPCPRGPRPRTHHMPRAP